MSFNHDVSRKTQAVIFSRKKTVSNHPIVFFDNFSIKREPAQTYLSLFLDEKKLDISMKEVKQVTKNINLLRKSSITLSLSPFLMIYK